jgi:hypothetical protein
MIEGSRTALEEGLLRVKKKNKETLFRSLTPSEASVHFRLCHFCFHLNESPTEATQCARCQRSLAAEVKSLQLSRKALQQEEEEYEEVRTGNSESVRRIPGHPRRKVPRLTGLTVDW